MPLPPRPPPSHTLYGRRALGPDLEEPKKLCFFYSRLQHRTTKAGASNSATPPPSPSPACQRIATTAWRRPRELQLRNCAVLRCGAAPPSGTTFLCLSDAMENQPSSGRWKNGAKNTIFKEREETLFCSLARAISNSYGGRFNKNLSRKSQRKLAFAMMDRIERNFCLV